MARRATRSISLPIVLSSVTVALSVFMLVAWIYVLLKNSAFTQHYVQNTSLLIGGVLSLGVIITVLVLFSVFLAREIREVRRQTSFIDSVTHELRSPLASIRLALETMARSELSADQRDRLRGMMLDDVERLTSLIDDILQANRIEHGEVSFESREIKLHELVHSCASAVCRRYKLEDDVVHIDVSQTLALRTDPAALGLVLKNLIDNAVKYSNPPLQVTVRAEVVEPTSVRISVHDRGVGIPRHDLKRIFERFYRAPEDDVRSRRGTGLGLFVVWALVKNMGGKLHAESQGRGHGAAFVVELPEVITAAPPGAHEVQR